MSDIFEQLLKAIEIKRMARVPYATVIRWLTIGHERAGILPSIDLAEGKKRHSYRIRMKDWLAFQAKMKTEVRVRRNETTPIPKPPTRSPKKGIFNY